MDQQIGETDETTAQTVGETLRISRQQRGIRLEDAAEATKISKQFLYALEHNRFDDLPSPAYLKGFLKTYAAYLQLDGAALIRQAIGEQAAEALAAAAGSHAGHSAVQSFQDVMQRFSLPALLLLGVVFSSLFIESSPPPNRLQSLQQLEARKVAQKPLSSAVQAAASSARILRPVAAATPQSGDDQRQEASAPQPVNHTSFTTRMRVTRNCTITVAIDDAASQTYELTSGDVIEWKAAHQIAFELSGTEGIELVHNGTPLRLSGAGRSGYLVLDATGIKR